MLAVLQALAIAAALLPAVLASPGPLAAAAVEGCIRDSLAEECEGTALHLLQTNAEHIGRRPSLELVPKDRGVPAGDLLQVNASSNSTKANRVEYKSDEGMNDSLAQQLSSPGDEGHGPNVSFLLDSLVNQVEYELNLEPEDTPVKNKVILCLLEVFLLGFFGIDRCYMGQICLGVIKGLTLGGLIFWWFLDFVAVVITCLSMSPAINAVGFRANFDKGTVTAAFVITLVMVSIKLCCCGLGVTISNRLRHSFDDSKSTAAAASEAAWRQEHTAGQSASSSGR